MRCIIALFCLGSAIAEDVPKSDPILPPAVQTAQQKWRVEAQIAREAYTKSVKDATRRLLDAVNREQQAATRSGRLDDAVALRDEAQHLQQILDADEIVISADPDALRRPAAPAPAREVKVAATATEVEALAVRKGQTVVIQYLRGQWTALSSLAPLRNPDVEDSRRHHLLASGERVLVRLAGKDGSALFEQELPYGTAAKPFTFTAEGDGTLRLGIRDTWNLKDNAGEVVYRVAVR